MRGAPWAPVGAALEVRPSGRHLGLRLEGSGWEGGRVTPGGRGGDADRWNGIQPLPRKRKPDAFARAPTTEARGGLLRFPLRPSATGRESLRSARECEPTM